MITASHNPAADNGYKLYLSDGAQVIPPVDAEIEGRIAALGPLSAVRAANLNDPLIARHGDEVAAAYLDAIVGPPAVGAAGTDLTVVYTPMHGVAGELMLRAIQRAGFAPPHVVAAQGKPDPDFPTVAFPNPEEPGALDLALADARAQGADLVLASDPDGDRLAVAVPAADGGWRQLKGDQVGALLGAFLLDSQTPAARDRLVATTSSPPRCCPRSRPRRARGARKRSPGSSGSPGRATLNRARRSSSGTRRRSATRSGRRFATRTASARRSPCWP